MKRNSLFSIILLVLLGIAAYFVLNREGEQTSTGTSGKTLVDYDSTAVDKMEIRTSSGIVILEKQAGTWMLTSPIHYKADETAATTAVGRGRRIELTGTVSTNPEKQSLFQVDSTGTIVKVFEKGTMKAAFYVGKPNNSFTETYVRIEGSNEVQLAGEMLSSFFAKQPKEWRDKTIFKTDQANIKSVKFQYGDTTFTLSLADSLWRIDRDSVNQTVVTPLLAALVNVQTDEFVDSSLVSQPRPSAIIELGDTQIRFFKKNDTTYLVQTSRSPQWFEVQSWKAANMLKRKRDLLPTKV